MLFFTMSIFLLSQNPKVQVVVSINEPDVEDQYPGLITEIESILRDTFQFSLKSTFSFIDFTEDLSDYKLKIELLDPGFYSSRSNRHAISLKITCYGTSIRPGIDSIFFPVSSYGTLYYYPRDYKAFVGNVAALFLTQLEAKKDLIVDGMLSHVPISFDAFYLTLPQTWAIPISYKETKIAKEESNVLIVLYPRNSAYSVKRIEFIVNSALCDIPDAVSNLNLPPTYPTGCLILRPVGDLVQIPDDIYTKMLVYVTKYTLLKPAGLSFENFQCDDYNY